MSGLHNDLPNKQFRVAGWIAMIDAILTIPYYLVSIRLNEMQGYNSRYAEAALMTASVFLSVSVTIYLGKYLKLISNSSVYDRIVRLIIFTNILTALIFILGRLIDGTSPYIETLTIATVIMQGIFNIRLSLLIIRSDFCFHKMVTIFAWVNLATGIFISSVILIPIALLTSAVSEVLLATIFMQKRDEPALQSKI